MGIDRIGKGGAPPQAPDANAPLDKKSGADKAFSVKKSEGIERPDGARQAAQASAAEAAQGPTPLARLRAGEIDVNGYMDLKVDEATKNLHGVPRADLDEIKRVLRDQMASDPGMADLVRMATGQIPKPPED